MTAPEKMSDEQIAGVIGFSVMTPNAIAYLAMGRAIESARDAQWQARLDAAVTPLLEALELIAAQHSGEVCSTKRSDCMAAIAQAAIRSRK